MGVEDVVDDGGLEEDGSEVLLPGGGWIRRECVLVSLRSCLLLFYSKKPCRSSPQSFQNLDPGRPGRLVCLFPR